MPKNKIRVYSLEVIAGGHSFYGENSIIPPDHEPALAAARVCRKIIRSWENLEFEDRRDIVIRFISSKQKV